MATIAFVTGVPRSGTTAMARLLNSHPDIAMMHERYGRAVGRPDFGPRYFTTERARTFVDGDGSRSAFDNPTTQAALAKWETAKVVGVKVPKIESVLRVADRFESAKVIAIVRDPFSVALSFQVRADREGDASWPKTRGYEAAVWEHNVGMAALLEAQKRNTGNLLVVRYEHVYSPGSDLTPIFRFLGVSPETGVQTAAHEQSFKDEEHRQRARIAAFVSAEAQFGSYRELLKTCALSARDGSSVTDSSTETDSSRGNLKSGLLAPRFLWRRLLKTSR